MPESGAPPAGFYEGSDGRRRWWNGAEWTDHVQPEAAVEPVGPTGAPSDARRRAALDQAVTAYVKHGYAIESYAGWQAVVGRRRRVSVLLNLVLAVVTGGLWLVVLAIRLLNWPVDRAVLTVDERGGISGEFS